MQWHEDGTKLKKKNSFNDFIKCIEYLINNNFTNPKKICVKGTSAGGLLIGAVTNKRPDLMQTAIMKVVRNINYKTSHFLMLKLQCWMNHYLSQNMSVKYS